MTTREGSAGSTPALPRPRFDHTPMEDTMTTPTTDAETVCVCGHPGSQHFEDACITEITGCSCGDYLPIAGAREEIDRLHSIIRAQKQPTEPAPDAELRQRIETAIGPTMRIGLQDAELDGPGGAQRIGEWVDWIADRLLPVVATERADAVREELLLNEVALRSASDNASTFLAAGSYAAAASLLRARAAAIRPQDGGKA